MIRYISDTKQTVESTFHEPTVSCILDLWEELRLYFAVTKSSEHCYMAEVLNSMYRDPQNILYLTFLKSGMRLKITHWISGVRFGSSAMDC